MDQTEKVGRDLEEELELEEKKIAKQRVDKAMNEKMTEMKERNCYFDLRTKSIMIQVNADQFGLITQNSRDLYHRHHHSRYRRRRRYRYIFVFVVVLEKS